MLPKKGTMSKRSLLPCLPGVLLVASHSVFAAAPLPVAGGQTPPMVPMQAPAATVPVVDFKADPAASSPQAATQPDGVQVLVNSLRVTGSTVYPEADLLALTGFVPGSRLRLADLRAMAAKVADHYRRNGYFLAQAYLPAQAVGSGVVTIAVMEGHYGQVKINNQTSLSDRTVSGQLEGLNPGDPVASVPLENRLLLLSDLPGVQVRSTLVPGASVGASDLVVDVTPGRPFTGSIDFDNGGNRYTGDYRLGATLNANNPLGLGDVASLRVLTSGPGLNYARAAYQLPVGKARVGVAYSHLAYELGREFDSLGASGTANIASVFGSYPLMRTRHSNLTAALALDAKTFDDDVATPASHARKKAQVLMASLYGDHRGGGGVSAYSVTWSAGNIDLQDPAVRAADAATARSNGHFNKLGFGASRLQSVGDRLSLYASINGQAASRNLDVSEKMELGGMSAVRAYPEGEAYGDQGAVLTLEARWRLMQPSPQQPGALDFIVFADAGTVTTHHSPWGVGDNRRSLSGAGVGLNWTVANDLVVKTYYARKLGNESATSAPDKSGRWWLQLVKYF